MREDGIVNTNTLLNDSATLGQAKEFWAPYLEITKGINTPHLFTVTKLSIMDTEVRISSIIRHTSMVKLMRLLSTLYSRNYW